MAGTRIELMAPRILRVTDRYACGVRLNDRNWNGWPPHGPTAARRFWNTFSDAAKTSEILVAGTLRSLNLGFGRDLLQQPNVSWGRRARALFSSSSELAAEILKSV